MQHPPVSDQITFLYTDDLTKSDHFYHQIVGLELVLDQGVCRIYRVGRDSYLGLCHRDGNMDGQGGVIFTLVTPFVDAWYWHLLDQGVTFDKEPTYNPDYQIYHCFFRDPNGYLLEIQEFRDPRWDACQQESG